MQKSSIALWIFNPFIRILPAFILGILSGVNFRIPVIITVSVILFLFIVLFSVRYLGAFQLSTFRKWIGVFVFSIIVCAGALVTWLNEPTSRQDWYGRSIEPGDVICVRLTEEPVATQSGFRATAEMVSAFSKKDRTKISGKVFVYFRDVTCVPGYGDLLLTNERPVRLNGALNPGGFNFRKYARNKGIYHAVYLNEKNFLKAGEDRNAFITFLNSSRRTILAKFQQFFPDRQVRGVAAALLIGYRADLDKPLLQEYSDAGVVHVIAISGLHLGLIYVVLVWLFSQLKFLRKFVALRCWLVLILLWLFSLLTGGSASVLRSAVMFSCILVGETYFKKSGTWNVMAASAFLLLVYDPLLLYDVGFLLSYAAVAGIVAWQRPLFHSFFIRNKLITQVWNMASVTIVAQLAAFPLCLYYFHQFPNAFLFTNLVVVPLSTIILFGEVLFLLLSFVPVVNVFLADGLSFLIRLMNAFVRWSNEIPYSVTHGIYADGLSTIAWYGIVICIAAWILNQRRQFALPGFIFITALSLYFLWLDVKTARQQKVIFYHAYNGLVIDLIDRGKAADLVYRSGNKVLDPAMYTKPARTYYRAMPDSQLLESVNERTGFGFQYRGRLFMVADRALNFQGRNNKVKIDYLVITGNPSIQLSGICAAVEPALVIFDASNSAWKIAQWKKECELLHLRCFSIRDSGALVKNLHPGSGK